MIEFGLGLTAYARPKLAIPWTFKGSCYELINVLNWINTLTLYLNQCWVDPEDWSGLDSTYMHNVMDVKFPDTLASPWDGPVTELKDRYLPPDQPQSQAEVLHHYPKEASVG